MKVKHFVFSSIKNGNHMHTQTYFYIFEGLIVMDVVAHNFFEHTVKSPPPTVF